MSRTTLQNIADIKRYFAENHTPYYFVSATNFNLMGMYEWVANWHDVNLIDCYDSAHPNVLLVNNPDQLLFFSTEEINAFLLQSREFTDLLQSQSQQGRAIFLFFDSAIEKLCQQLQLEIVLPKNDLVRQIDSKIVTTEIGNQAGVHSVPNVLTRIGSYAELQRVAANANLGSRWVVQSAYGDSGKTTYFIANEEDYQSVASAIESQGKVKVMRWVNCTGTAIEACATRWGTFVGPLLTEIIGAEALTPYPGGWCGNELYDGAFSAHIRRQVQQKTRAMGDALYQRGYRGYFELDFLLDLDSNEIYLGELNARITGISAMTNMSDFSARQIPLFLFHLLEYDPQVDLQLTPDSFNQQMLTDGAEGTAAQLILKYSQHALQKVEKAPVSGVYKLLADGRLQLQHSGYARREALAKDEAFVLRILEQDEFAYHGADLAIMFVNRVIREPQGRLNPVGTQWVTALRDSFQLRPLTQEERSALELAQQPANVKNGRAE